MGLVLPFIAASISNGRPNLDHFKWLFWAIRGFVFFLGGNFQMVLCLWTGLEESFAPLGKGCRAGIRRMDRGIPSLS